MQLYKKFKFEYSPRRLITTFLTFVLLFGLFPILNIKAENVYDPIFGTQLFLEKYLIYNGEINCPSVTFNYVITPGDTISGTKDKQDILSGANEHVSGSPTIVSAVFTENSTKYSSSQPINPAIGNHGNITHDPVVLDTGEVYSKYDAMIDFSHVSFSAPGVYRWKIEETNTPENTIDISDKVRYLDVYVSQISPDGIHQILRINGYVLHNVKEYQPNYEGIQDEPIANNTNTKAIGFISKYQSSNFVLYNSTAGNQAALDKYFKYDLEFSYLSPDTTIYLDGQYDQIISDKIVASQQFAVGQTKTNPSSLRTDSSGNLNTTIYLKKGQYIEFKGITEGFNINATVTNADYTTEGMYLVGNFQTIQEIENIINSSDRSDFVKFSGNSVHVDNVGNSLILLFSNVRDGTVSTGIIQAVFPGMLLIFISIFGLLFVRRKSA